VVPVKFLFFGFEIGRNAHRTIIMEEEPVSARFLILPKSVWPVRFGKTGFVNYTKRSLALRGLVSTRRRADPEEGSALIFFPTILSGGDIS